MLLSKSFFVQFLHGEDTLSGEMLLASFRRYVSDSERALIDRCINGTVKEDDDELLEFLSNFDCKVLPKVSNLSKLLQELAHKELIQKPQYVAECWREVIKQLQPHVPTLEHVNELCQRLVPTNVKVLDALRVELTNEAERECFKHLKRYLRGLEKSKLEKFLKFTTGSELMLFNELQVTFIQHENAARRPIAHTCSFCTRGSLHLYNFPRTKRGV